MTEILNELPQLDDHERQTVLRRLAELDARRGLPHATVSTSRTLPNPMAALNFAREHGLEEGSTADWMKRLRDGEED